jgi:hypothetical protein
MIGCAFPSHLGRYPFPSGSLLRLDFGVLGDTVKIASQPIDLFGTCAFTTAGRE